MIFTPTLKSLASRDLIQIKAAVSGRFGELRIGGVKVPVLRLEENVFVTTEKEVPGVRAMLNIEGMDLHHVKTPADTTRFISRFKKFDKGA
jgi:hypothetical protein